MARGSPGAETCPPFCTSIILCAGDNRVTPCPEPWTTTSHTAPPRPDHSASALSDRPRGPSCSLCSTKGSLEEAPVGTVFLGSPVCHPPGTATALVH